VRRFLERPHVSDCGVHQLCAVCSILHGCHRYQKGANRCPDSLKFFGLRLSLALKTGCSSLPCPASTNPPLHYHCSLHHSPLDVSASVMESSNNASDHYRLPTEVHPRHYSLTIRMDLEKEEFTGFVKIECVLRLSPVVDNCTLPCMPQPRNRESDQDRHLQPGGRAFTRPSHPYSCILRHTSCTCRDKLRCHHRARVVDVC